MLFKEQANHLPPDPHLCSAAEQCSLANVHLARVGGDTPLPSVSHRDGKASPNPNPTAVVALGKPSVSFVSPRF